MSTKFDIEVTLVELINNNYTSRKCFASARVAAPRLGALATQYHSHSQNIIFWTSDPNNYIVRSQSCNVFVDVFVAFFTRETPRVEKHSSALLFFERFWSETRVKC
jgi:hypothetical protein